MTRQYIGARYVPIFADPIEWDIDRSYQALTIVTHYGNSYTSKKNVPVRTEITNTEYWVVTGNYNAQLELYRQEVESYKDEIEDYIYNNQILNVKDFGAKGDGVTDDTTAIQAAINHCHDNGGGVVGIPASDGEYIYTTILVREGVTLEGFGGVLKLADNTLVDASASYYTLHNLDNDNAHYKNLIINQNRSNGNTSFTVADAITAVGDKTTVEGCFIYNICDSGIMFSAVSNGRCCDNVIIGATDCGIYINNGAVLESAKNNNISGNKIINSAVSAIACKRNLTRHTISNNFIDGAEYGISFERASTDTDWSYDNNVFGNDIRNCEIGIILQASVMTMVSDNKIIDFSSSGIDVRGGSDNSIISGNYCKASDSIEATEKVFAMLAGARGSNRCLVSGNYFDGVGRVPAVYIYNSGEGVNTKNKISGNFCRGAIRINSGNVDNVVSDNSIEPGGDYALNIFEGQNSFFNNAILAGGVTNHVAANNGSIIGMFAGKKVTQSGDVPTSGTWAVGDICLNNSPTAAGVFGWVCITAGTPGSWAAIATT